LPHTDLAAPTPAAPERGAVSPDTMGRGVVMSAEGELNAWRVFIRCQGEGGLGREGWQGHG